MKYIGGYYVTFNTLYNQGAILTSQGGERYLEEYPPCPFTRIHP